MSSFLKQTFTEQGTLWLQPTVACPALLLTALGHRHKQLSELFTTRGRKKRLAPHKLLPWMPCSNLKLSGNFYICIQNPNSLLFSLPGEIPSPPLACLSDPNTILLTKGSPVFPATHGTDLHQFQCALHGSGTWSLAVTGVVTERRNPRLQLQNPAGHTGSSGLPGPHSWPISNIRETDWACHALLKYF